MPRVNATFNGVTRIISIALGVSSVDVLALYSDWKEWAQLNSGFPIAFRSSGGDVSAAGDVRGQYIDITNGWQIQIAQSVEFSGNIFRDSLDPIGNTVPVVLQEAGVKTSTFLVSNLAGAVQVATGSGLSSEQNTWLSELHQTLASAGLFSPSALVNAPISDATLAQQTAILAAIAALPAPSDATLANQASILSAIAALPTPGDASNANQLSILDILALLGYTAGNPVTVNENTGDITTSDGKRVRVNTTNGTTTITRDDP